MSMTLMHFIAFLTEHKRSALLVSVIALLGCASAPLPVDSADRVLVSSRWAQHSGVIDEARQVPIAQQAPWSRFLLPGKKETQYTPVTVNGRGAVQGFAESSASMLRRKVDVRPDSLRHVRFSWMVADLIAEANMADRDLDDSPVRVVFAFDGDRSRLSAKNVMLSELSHALTGEPMPYAVLMYVWSKNKPVGSIIHSPRTDRIRKLVVESGPARLQQWLDFERDLKADYEHVFQEPVGPLKSIGIMTDTDNTRSTVRSLYGPVMVTTR